MHCWWGNESPWNVFNTALAHIWHLHSSKLYASEVMILMSCCFSLAAYLEHCYDYGISIWLLGMVIHIDSSFNSKELLLQNKQLEKNGRSQLKDWHRRSMRMTFCVPIGRYRNAINDCLLIALTAMMATPWCWCQSMQMKMSILFGKSWSGNLITIESQS